ncbi:hypothetical protein [Petralouisia muris]|nr:hypothetical protein [Petralouisia muris]
MTKKKRKGADCAKNNRYFKAPNQQFQRKSEEAACGQIRAQYIQENL